MNRRQSRVWMYVFGWMMISVVSITALRLFSDRWLANEVTSLLHVHFSEVLDESLFSDASGRVNKNAALLSLGQQINEQIRNAVSFGPFALHRQCTPLVTHIDGLQVAEILVADHLLLKDSIERNHSARRIEVSVSCETNYLVLVSLCCLFALVFVGLYCLRPRPLERRHKQLLEWLQGQGYDLNTARMIVFEFQYSALEFDECQHEILNCVHNARIKNAREAIIAAIAYKSELTNPLDRLWYKTALKWENFSPDEALNLAKRNDRVTVNLPKSMLTIRDLEIPLRKTALLYYGWYVLALREGDGWIINPSSNKPDIEQGAKLAEFMCRFNGHAKAINDLEQSGLKATTLDQNRCKIKDEVTAKLGPELAKAYLFQTEKDERRGRTRYRLALTKQQFQLID